jgi:serine/threonine protein kinase
MNRRAGDPSDTVPHSPFAETLAATPVGPPPVGPSPDVSTLAAGEPVDARYVWRDRLGEGGMGEIRLYHDERLGRDVAMKVMRADHVGRADLDARFLREARVQGRIEHPSVVPVYDLGMAGGTPFFTMKRVHGPTLAQILAELRAGARPREGEGQVAERYSRHKLLAAFASVCLTVDFAHAHGVVHRDLKPDNIMLGSYGELYVLDWGIAKIVDSVDLASSPALDRTGSQTKAGAFFGTLGYMAPEQLDPSFGRTDARSDVYALGAILFEILTLEPLHPLERADKMVASTLMATPRRPSARAPSRGVPPELDDICARATAREPSQRFASARDLHSALERFREKDRDLDQRRAGAQEHAARAIAAAKTAETELDPEAPARTLALREASRALAFDPSHMGAALALRALLASPPRVLPPEVVAELGVDTQRLFARVARGGALLQLSWLCYLPFAMLMGIRDVTAYVVVSLLFLASAADGLRRSRRPPADGRLPLPSALLVAVSVASLSLVMSPFVLVPSAAVAFAVVLIVVRRSRAWPALPVLMACAVVIVPVLLAQAHVLPPFFAQDGKDILILPRMVELPERLTLGVTTVAHVFILGSVAAWFIELRSGLDEAQVRLRHHAWQLRQLVAAEPAAQPSLLPPEPAPRSEDAPPLPTAVDTGGGRQSLDALLALEPKGSTRYDERGRVRTDTEGAVVLCEDHRIGRQVAMKVIAKDDPEEAALARQVRIQARLEHPSIPPIYDMGEDDSGALYVTTRRLRGTTLAHAIADRQRYSLHKLLETFGAACLAIDYAHANGVAHSALTTHCIVLGDYGEVYVTGWGSAVELRAPDGRAEADAGTRSRADIAALGAILGDLLDVPVVGADELGGRASLLPPVTYAPPELEAICARATGAPGPPAFAAAGELHEAVERFIEGERDVVRRKARASEHARIAALAAERAFADGEPSARASAMQEVSQALALDPSNARATGVLMRLFTVPPRELPAEAAQEMARAVHDEQRRAARTAALLYATFFLYVPAWIAQGLLSPWLSVLVPTAMLAAVLAFWRVARSRTSAGEPFATVVFAMLAASAIGTVAGPLIFVQTIVIGNLGGFVLQAGHRRRVLAIVLGCLAFAAPIGAQLAGLLPPSYAARGSALAILPHLTALPPYATLVIAVAHVAVIFSTCIFFRRFRDSLQLAEESVHVNTWQLRQLVPLEARAAVSIAPPAL